MFTQIRALVVFFIAGSATAPAIFAQARPAPRAHAIAFRSGSGHLGIGVAEVDAERAKALSLKEERGVEVKSVEENSPAAKAGVKNGDVVLDYNGQRVEGVDQFIRMVSETPAGRKCTLLISRGGSTQTLSATLEPGVGHQAFDWSMGNDRMVMNIPMPPMPPITVRIPDLPRTLMSWQSSTLGIESESLNSQLAEFFGVKEGVLVRSVMKDSAGEKAGLKAGDVIVKVDGSKVTSPKEISSLLRSARSRKAMSMTLVRNRKEMNVDVKLDDVSKWPSREERAVL